MPALIEAFGHREADTIKPPELDAYISTDAKAPATQNRLRALFSLIYREALRNGDVTSNPARLVRMRPVNDARIRWLTSFDGADALETFVHFATQPVPRLGARLRAFLGRGR